LGRVRVYLLLTEFNQILGLWSEIAPYRGRGSEYGPGVIFVEIYG
jgi:hypothetical protein